MTYGKRNISQTVHSGQTASNGAGSSSGYINPFRLFVASLIPQWLEQMAISDGAKLTYGRLARYADKDTGIATDAKQRDLAVALHKSEKTIRKHLSELEAESLIESRRLGHWQSNEYRFPAHPAMNSYRKPAVSERNPSTVPSYKRDILLRRDGGGRRNPLPASLEKRT